jgi:hypothetical protein
MADQAKDIAANHSPGVGSSRMVPRLRLRRAAGNKPRKKRAHGIDKNTFEY